MTLARNSLKDEDPRKFAEERRLILLLGIYIQKLNLKVGKIPIKMLFQRVS